MCCARPIEKAEIVRISVQHCFGEPTGRDAPPVREPIAAGIFGWPVRPPVETWRTGRA